MVKHWDAIVLFGFKILVRHSCILCCKNFFFFYRVCIIREKTSLPSYCIPVLLSLCHPWLFHFRLSVVVSLKSIFIGTTSVASRSLLQKSDNWGAIGNPSKVKCRFCCNLTFPRQPFCFLSPAAQENLDVMMIQYNLVKMFWFQTDIEILRIMTD